MGKLPRAMKAGATRGQPVHQMLDEQVPIGWQATMIEAGGRMRCQARRQLLRKDLRAARQVERCVRGSANGDMVWVPIHAIIPKGEDHVWSKGPEYFGHCACQALLVTLLELAIPVVQAAHMLHAKHLAGTAEFLSPHLPQRPARGRMGIADLPRLAL